MTLFWVLLLGLLICCAAHRKNANYGQAPNCGRYNSYGQDRGIGQGVARLGEFPWMVAVLDRRDGLTRYIGGGSLIAANVVLTAVHILGGTVEDDLLVRAGEWNVSSTAETPGHVDLGVEKAILHDQYNSFSGENDIALLILKASFPVQRNIGTVCLPPPNRSFVGQRCFFNGWGPMEAHSEDYPSVPKKVDVRMLDKTLCQELWQKPVPTNAVCAESPHHKAAICKGDGGSPLVCPLPQDPTRFEQAGIVTFGAACGTDTIPSVYTAVSMLRRWINYHLRKKNIYLGY